MARRSDTGPFAMVPEWIIYLPISDRALRLYTVLSRKADDKTDESWPSRRWLWEHLKCSERSLDAAVRELEEVGALQRRHRRNPDGSPTSNLWTVIRLPPPGLVVVEESPDSAPGGATSDAGGGAGIAAQNESQLEREPVIESNHSALSAPDADLRVFRAWQDANGHHRARWTPDRRRLTLKWLRYYDEHDLIDAVRGVRKSAHHMGENDRHTVYDDYELCLRDAKHIEMFGELERGTAPVPLIEVPVKLRALELVRGGSRVTG